MSKSTKVDQKEKGSCSCCVDSIKIENVIKIDNARYMGHSFDTVIGLSYPASRSTPTSATISCTLEWWEKTNVPYVSGMQANTWTDMTKNPLTALSFDASWGARTEPCPGSEIIRDTDTPALAKRYGRTVRRILEFRIVVKSTSDTKCTNLEKEVTARQVLTMINGQPDWNNSRFETP